MVECNDTAAAYPRDLTLPQLFARQAAETPGAIAVVAGAQSLTYRDVEQRSDALARQLLSRGFGPSARVGVFVNRTADLVIAPLAILKTGQRLRSARPDLSARTANSRSSNNRGWLRSSRNRRSCRRPCAPCRSLRSAAPSKPATTADAASDCLRSIAEDTAYVIFTSGSTGQPKGVQISHGALTNFLCAMRGTPGFTARDTIVAVTTICFDIAALELFLPLTLGAKVVIASEEETRDGRLLLSLLKRAGARVLQATPATWELLIEAGWRGDPELRMLCGGEPLPRHLAERLLDRSPELWNMYGPTETTIWSSARRITRGDGPILIGPPIANTQFYVVDRERRIGSAGRDRRIADRRRRRRSRLLGHAGADPRALPGRLVPRRAGREAVPDRRPGADARRTANFSISAGAISRSSCAGSGSNSVRSRRFCSDTPPSAVRSR